MSRKLKSGLTEQQGRFLDLYRSDPEHNATRAYRLAYPRCKSDAAAAVEASKLLRNPKIADFLDEKARSAEHRADISEARILDELAKLAFFNPKRLYDEDGNIIPIHKLPDDVAAALNGVEISFERATDGSEVQTGTKKLKWHDKKSALELLGKSRGIKAWVERTESTVNVRTESDEELDAKIAQLLRKAGAC